MYRTARLLPPARQILVAQTRRLEAARELSRRIRQRGEQRASEERDIDLYVTGRIAGAR